MTTAPIEVMSINWSSSFPAAAQPDAVNTGDSKLILAKSTDMSTEVLLGTLFINEFLLMVHPRYQQESDQLDPSELCHHEKQVHQHMI